MRAPLVISGRQVHRPPPAGWMRAECAFHSGRGSVSFRYRGRGIFTPSINRAPRNASNVLRNLLSTCGFFLYYTAPIPGIGTIPATPGHQGHGCCWDSVARGGVFNRNSILSCGVIGAFCRISWHDARSSVVTNAMLVLCSLFYVAL